MEKFKYQLGQRVKTPLGAGEIDILPYNKESKRYGVWLDRPFRRGDRMEHLLIIEEKDINHGT